MTTIQRPCSSSIPRPDLCLNQGSCPPHANASATPAATVCVCPSGFASDDLLFHMGNW